MLTRNLTDISSASDITALGRIDRDDFSPSSSTTVSSGIITVYENKG